MAGKVIKLPKNAAGAFGLAKRLSPTTAVAFVLD
jgi:hypothetical protein